MAFKLIGIGEVLWDLLPAGRQLGGAPANFAYHAHALGAQACMISSVGRDSLGREIISRLMNMGLSEETIQIDNTAPTGTVTVTLAKNSDPQYTIHENVAWDRLMATPAAMNAVRNAHAVCFGSLAQRNPLSRAAIQLLVATAPANALRIFDINLRQHYYSREIIEQSLALANVLKINDTELAQLAEMLGLGGDMRDRMAQLAQRHALRVVACTRGEHGSLLYVEGRWSDNPGQPAKVADTVGAGDSFTAAMALGLLAGWDIDTVNQRANEVAAYVASCTGATPVLPDSLCAPFRECPAT